MDRVSKHWYREPWPWLLMVAPLAAVLMGVVMMVLATRSNDGLVADDYYRQGLAINQILDRERRAATLHVSGVLEFSANRRQVRLRLDQDGDLPPALSLAFVHPTRAGLDQTVTLIRSAPGMYSGEMRVPVVGRWLLTLEDDDRRWRVSGVWRTEADRVALRPVGEKDRQ